MTPMLILSRQIQFPSTTNTATWPSLALPSSFRYFRWKLPVDGLLLEPVRREIAGRNVEWEAILQRICSENLIDSELGLARREKRVAKRRSWRTSHEAISFDTRELTKRQHFQNQRSDVIYFVILVNMKIFESMCAKQLKLNVLMADISEIYHFYKGNNTGPVAQWIRRRSTEPKIRGSSPRWVNFDVCSYVLHFVQ